MKKMNKKGFTLAELLIVIAIIAILIAIAIPAFSGALDQAKIQTDHANMRSAYSIAQTANLLETIDVTSGGVTKTVKAGKQFDGTTDMGTSDKYVFQKDGTIAVGSSNDYETQVAVKANDSKCSACVVCCDTTNNTDGHKKGATIQIKKVSDKWVVVLDGGTAAT